MISRGSVQLQGRTTDGIVVTVLKPKKDGNATPKPSTEPAAKRDDIGDEIPF
jgi:hypothetical protein